MFFNMKFILWSTKPFLSPAPQSFILLMTERDEEIFDRSFSRVFAILIFNFIRLTKH